MISRGLAKAAEEKGVEIRLDSPVKKLDMTGRKVKGVILENGETLSADETIVNADFGYAMTKLVDEGVLKKWTDKKLSKKLFSCSTFMLYLGLDKLYDYPHHTIIFADDYQKNIEDVADRKVLSGDYSFYVRNSSITDPRVAPEGHSAVYVLVPTPNNKSNIDWIKEGPAVRDKILDLIATKTDMTDIKDHIVEEKVVTPNGWEEDYNVYLGATFNLGHNISQMLYLRPRNRFEELDNCWLVGGGTHPGSGVPTILESARITANLMSKKYGIPFTPPSSLSRKDIE